MKNVYLSFLVFMALWQTPQWVVAFDLDSEDGKHYEMFKKYLLRYIHTPESRTTGHQIMGSAALGSKGLSELEDYFAHSNMRPLKSIIYVHKEGFEKNNEDNSFALEEKAHCREDEINFFHYYIDGLNPLEITHPIHTPLKDEKLFEVAEFVNEDFTDISLYKILSLALDRENQPVLIHCRAGKHRTAMIQMVLRYLEGGLWTDPKHQYSGKFRYKERKDYYIKLNDLLPLEYEYYVNAGLKARMENINFIRNFMKDSKHLGLRESLKKLYKNS